jgi:chromosome segregation ATPase
MSDIQQTKCLEDGWKKLGEGWENPNKAKEKYQRVKAEADKRRAGDTRVTAVYADEHAAAAEVRKWEGILAELEDQMKDLEQNLKTLKERKDKLTAVPCAAGKAAPSPPG